MATYYWIGGSIQNVNKIGTWSQSTAATWSTAATTKNLCWYSQEFDNASSLAWVYGNSTTNGGYAWGWYRTVTANVSDVLAPDGTQTVDKFVANTGGSSGVQQAFNLTGGVAYTFSMYVYSPSANPGTTMRISIDGQGAYNAASGNQTVIGQNASLTRYSVTYTPPSNGTYYMGVFASGGIPVYVWGAQLETGAAMTSYVYNNPSSLVSVIPTLSDSVVFDSGSTYTATLSGSIQCSDFTVTTGKPTFSNSTASLTVAGSFTYSSSQVGTFAADLVTFNSNSTGKTITTNGMTISSPITFNGVGGDWTLGSALTLSTGAAMTFNAGTFNTGNYALNLGKFIFTGTPTKVVNLGSSNITLNSASPINLGTATNYTFNAGTSTINLAAANSDLNAGAGLTFYNVAYAPTASGNTFTMNVPHTFNQFSVNCGTIPSMTYVVTWDNQTIGTLDTSNNLYNKRVFFQTYRLAINKTFTVTTLNTPDCDWRDITLAGTAANSSPLRAGNCGGNSGITFPAAKTVYWNLAASSNWHDNGWCEYSGGIPNTNFFPLAQDTAAFDNSGSASTITINMPWNIGSIDGTSRTTTGYTISIATSRCEIYGNVNGGSVIGWSNPNGYSFAQYETVYFSGRGTQTFTSNGKQFGWINVVINNFGGTVAFADNFVNINGAGGGYGTYPQILLAAGTLQIPSGGSVRTGAFDSTATGIPAYQRSINFNSGTFSIEGSSWRTIFWNVVSTNLTFSGTGTLSIYSGTFTGGGMVYPVTLNASGSTITIVGNNTFNDITNAVNSTLNFTAGSTNSFYNWSIKGSYGITAPSMPTISSTASGTKFNLVKLGGGYVYGNNINISDSNVTPANTWYATRVSNIYASNTGWNYMTARYWVGGNGTWGDNTYKDNWAMTSGGTGGAPPPTIYDDVYFDGNSGSGSYTVNKNATDAYCKSLTVSSGTPSFVFTTSAMNFFIYGSLTLNAGTTVNANSRYVYLLFSSVDSNASYTVNCSGKGFGRYTFGYDGSFSATIQQSCTWTLGGAITVLDTSSAFQLFYGTLDTASYSITSPMWWFPTSTSNRVIKLNNSTINLTTASANPFQITSSSYLPTTFDAGTSTFNLTSTYQFNTNGAIFTFYDMNISVVGGNTTSDIGNYLPSKSNGFNINDAHTFHNLTFNYGYATKGVTPVLIYGNLTINGTLAATGTTPTKRLMFMSTYFGNPRLITANSISAPDCDWMDLIISGNAAGSAPLRAGNCGGNTGLVFTSKDVWFNTALQTVNWYDNVWASATGGTAAVENFPLPQDTVYFDDNTSYIGAITLSFATELYSSGTYNIPNLNFASRTGRNITLTGLNYFTTFGNIIFPAISSNITVSSLAQVFTLKRGNQIFENIGNKFSPSNTLGWVLCNANGSIVLNSNITFGNGNSTTVSHYAGTINLNGYTLTVTGYYRSYEKTDLLRAVNFGAGGIFSLSTSLQNPLWDISPTNFSVSGTGKIYFSNQQTGQRYFTTRAAFNYTGITLESNGTINLYNPSGAISGTVFVESLNVIPWSGQIPTLYVQPGTTWSFNNFNVSGLNTSSRIAISPISAGTIILNKANGGVVNCDYLSITSCSATGATFYAGYSSVNVSGNSGWIFSAAPYQSAFLEFMR